METILNISITILSILFWLVVIATISLLANWTRKKYDKMRDSEEELYKKEITK